MDIIEQAAKRLAELRKSGVDVPDPGGMDDAAIKPASDATSTVFTAQPGASPADSRSYAALGDFPDKRVDEPGAGLARPATGEDGIASSTAMRRVEIDLVGLASRGIITPDTARSQLGAELRILKRPLLRNASGKGAARIKDANLIMITSAVPGEGKSYLAANLAMSIAMELDHTVLLVDADVERPSLPRVLGFDHDHGKGLLDVLIDSELDLGQVMIKTNIDKLSILPSGTPHPRATELLASGGMNKLLAEMVQRYSDRIIIFDSPPLLVTTEARVLAAHMGQVVMVVKAESTSHSEVKHAVAALEVCPVKMVVLNQTTGHFDGHGYGYGYGYGYESGPEAQVRDQAGIR
jgi:exopolysaccharide/PEP-CTERM locus tyrosine autokinase